MKRREFITLIAGAAAPWPLAARAQQPRVYTFGVLTLPNPEALLQALREGLRDAGYVEGSNLRLEIRSAAGRPDLQLDKATELVRLKVDLIITFFTPAAVAAKQATRDIPIVMAGAGDPVETGLVTSLARPGGNVTGQSSGGAEVAGKSVELIREFIPAARRVGVLADESDPFAKAYVAQIGKATRSAWDRGGGPAWSRPVLRRVRCSRQGQFPQSLAKHLLASHRAAQSQPRSLSGTLRPEAVRRSVEGAGLRFASRSAKWAVILHGVGVSH